MSYEKVKGLLNGSNWEDHKKSSYQKCRGEHTSTWKSWGKTLFRSGNKVDTSINTVGHAATAAGVVTGALALESALVTGGTVAGAVLGAAAATASLYALPLVITAAAIAYWGYKKSEANKINVEIWEYWKLNLQGNTTEIVLASIEPKKLTSWLAWFGDQGISNMNHMGAKNVEAKKAFDEKFKAIQTRRQALQAKVNAINKIAAPQARDQAANANAERERLCADYLELGKDLQYITYRVERFEMYHAMLDLTARGVANLADVPKVKAAAVLAVVEQDNSYAALRIEVLGVPDAKGK